MFLMAESPNDINDFVAGYLASLREGDGDIYRCLFISDADAWRYVSVSRSPHILVA